VSRLVSDIVLSLTGRRIAVMCGGPSLTSALSIIDSCDARVSANDHGCRLRQCDYIVACDAVHTVDKTPMEPRLRAYNVPIVSPMLYADWRLNDWEYAGNSGMAAIYIAWLLGASLIVVAGADCYTGDTYWHTPGVGASSGHNRLPSDFIDRAGKLRDIMPGAVVRVTDGPLTAVWPAYDPAESLPAYVPSPALLALAVPPAQRTVRMRETSWLGNNRLLPLHLYTLTVSEAARYVDTGRATWHTAI